MGRFLLIIGALFFIMAADKAGASDPENQIFLDLKDGRVVIDLLPDVAPKHVERIKELTREGFYNGIVFHRVIDGFMAQTGDPTGTGTGGSGKKLVAEFIGTLWLVLGGCGSAVLAAGFPELGIGFVGVSLAFGLTVLTWPTPLAMFQDVI